MTVYWCKQVYFKCKSTTEVGRCNGVWAYIG